MKTLTSVSALLFRAIALAPALAIESPRPPDNGNLPDCPLAGPSFPTPSHLSNSTVFSNAIKNLNTQIADESLGLNSNTTAWAVAVFSAKENKTLFERYHMPGDIDVGVNRVDKNSIFRIGSVSKVFTVWAFLATLGDSRFNDPITKYIPELANASSPAHDGAIYDDIESARWEDVTVGDLASHSAGIARDVGFGDLSVDLPAEALEMMGLPKLDPTDQIKCGWDAVQRPCTRTEFFQLLLQKTPTYPSSHSPAYSNLAFHLLGYVLEEITGKDIETTMTEDIFQRLGMAHSSYAKTPASGGVIPGDAKASGWDDNLGVDSAGGSLYMSTGDLITAGQAVLQSKLISPAQTRRWFQARMQTGYLGAAVGAPWEITYLVSPTKHLTQYVTKDGDLEAYHSTLVLVPEYEIGFVGLAAGAPDSNGTNHASLIRTILKTLVGDVIMPAVEEQARIEAHSRFSGTYTNEAGNSSVVIEASGGHSGLIVRSLVNRGVSIVGPGSDEGPWKPSLHFGGNYTRLFPTTLKTLSRSPDSDYAYESRVGFRAAFHPQRFISGAVQDPCMLGWGNLDGVTYGKKAIDDWVFNMSEEGGATSVDIPMLRLSLERSV